MEYGIIEREFHIDASPEVVFEVISTPAHIREWWNAEADLAPVAGATGELVWGDPCREDAHVARLTVVEAERPRLFSFRWVYADDAQPTSGNSLLVTMTLVPTGEGTTVRLTETGFRERGWEAAVLEQQYNEHVVGWDTHFAGGLRTYLTKLVTAP
ncbi:MAG: Activator of Hsp90 ATPase 1 family protein [Frankiales bacterium]|nr:Activator of Hsp90 ATPase 1 family protein [Frankiales bacterium]MCW2708131.1 Activator of Hsp90 ATPase 1 family protein [Frankiales bacterium]